MVLRYPGLLDQPVTPSLIGEESMGSKPTEQFTDARLNAYESFRPHPFPSPVGEGIGCPVVFAFQRRNRRDMVIARIMAKEDSRSVGPISYRLATTNGEDIVRFLLSEIDRMYVPLERPWSGIEMLPLDVPAVEEKTLFPAMVRMVARNVPDSEEWGTVKEIPLLERMIFKGLSEVLKLSGLITELGRESAFPYIILPSMPTATNLLLP